MRIACILCVVCLWSAGCDQPKRKVLPQPAPNVQGAPAENAPDAAPAPNQPQGFSQLEWKLVDKRKALEENPALIETENHTNASDPFSAAAQSYFTIGSQANILNFRHNLDILKAAEDRNPTFEEFNTMFKQANVQLKGVYPWQVYAYDDQEGTICILEDRAEKERLYKAQGLELPNP